MTTRLTAPLGGLALVALVAACGTESGEDPSTTRVSTVAQSPSPQTPRSESPPSESAPSESPNAQSTSPFAGSTVQRYRPAGTGSSLVFTGVRTAEHEGFDRIVLQFSGTGRPGWSVNYVGRARLDGSGTPVRLAGDSQLDVYGSANEMDYLSPDYYDGPRRVAGAGAITEVYVGGTFEGATQVLAGIDGPRAPFRVFALTHPSRLVVDVARTPTSDAD